VWAGTYLLGPIFALLPQRWREKVFHTTPNRLARVTTLSGILEAVLALVGFVVWYSMYVTLASRAISHSSPERGGASERMGLFAYIWFWLNPITWVVAYFGLEGIVRSVAALSTGESYGTLPLFLVERLFGRATRASQKVLPPIVTDEITTGDATCDMKIASCRAKAEWKYPFTIRYGGGYFQVIADLYLGAGPRPYIYSLRRLPPGEIARGLKEYSPTDVLSLPRRVEKIEK
jgi:hypothetical protein